MKTKIITTILATVLITTLKLNSATHTVTNGNDSGTGSLRQIVLNANSGDTIIFASNVSDVYLVEDDIIIDKDLTIIGGTGDDKVTIYAGSRRIFYIDVDYELAISNLILTGAYHNNYGDDGGAVYVDYSTFIADNCIFSNNVNQYGGAVGFCMVISSQLTVYSQIIQVFGMQVQ